MHRSRIGIVLIDHAEQHDAALAFWSGVTGVAPTRDEDGPYTAIGTIGSLNLEVQRLGRGTPARIHLDIETDDLPAEIDRLTGLCGTVVERKQEFSIMQDPGGWSSVWFRCRRGSASSARRRPGPEPEVAPSPGLRISPS